MLFNKPPNTHPSHSLPLGNFCHHPLSHFTINFLKYCSRASILSIKFELNISLEDLEHGKYLLSAVGEFVERWKLWFRLAQADYLWQWIRWTVLFSSNNLTCPWILHATHAKTPLLSRQPSKFSFRDPIHTTHLDTCVSSLIRSMLYSCIRHSYLVGNPSVNDSCYNSVKKFSVRFHVPF